ncbi:hypothetical protein G2W53_003724 [Senna tora]|uniref:Uncharacterized protein n=1 Tax=Senna tora TaxID=362788 RepID=A0A835CH98_9FABA|nr:hypothetical protein G2W53_003724 [Senna tora]
MVITTVIGNFTVKHILVDQADFIVVAAPSVDNFIIGCPMLNKLQAIVSTSHLVMKFPSSD